MAKHLKINIKNVQLAQAINLGGLKEQAAKLQESHSPAEREKVAESEPISSEIPRETKEEGPKIKARSKSVFAEPPQPAMERQQQPTTTADSSKEEELPRPKSTAELRRQIFGDDVEAAKAAPAPPPPPVTVPEPISEVSVPEIVVKEQQPTAQQPTPPPPSPAPTKEKETEAIMSRLSSIAERRPPPQHSHPHPHPYPHRRPSPATPSYVHPPRPPTERLGPTGRHVKDLLPPPRPKVPPQQRRPMDGAAPSTAPKPPREGDKNEKERRRPPPKPRTDAPPTEAEAAEAARRKAGKAKDFRDVKPAPRKQESRSFDARDRHGLRSDEEGGWRKRRSRGSRAALEDTTIRPTTLKVRLPITVKDLAAEMKLKAAQLIAKLFMQGVAVTLNDLLEDEVVIQLLGQEFGCEISIDHSEEERIRITDKSIREEISEEPSEKLQLRAPVVAFMGHVDHGKTSLIDAIRKSNRVANEAGAITQHIGAFRCSTAVGDIAILDTPGHEAFSAMRARGADVTDIVVLVVAGDEGIRQQTVEAIQHAKAAKVTIVVAINKCDKPNFNAETVYRQLADQELLPEVWGGQTITINCSAVTGEGISTLLEMLALQAEVLELKANPTARARGTVLESELHKGLGAVATVLVQNGTLHHGDAVVFGQCWGRIKTMHDEFKHGLKEAGPSTPVEITGLSALPEAGHEFIVVKNEKEAREIAEARSMGIRQTRMQQVRKVYTVDNLFQQTTEGVKKVLNLILRADVQGSLEALKIALMKIESDKVELSIIMAGVGEISESDVQMAEASNAVILGFHSQVESHAEALIKQYGIIVHLHDIIYHAVDQVKALMTGLLDKIAEEQERGVVEVKTTFKSSQYGVIAGCQVSEGSIHRNHLVRVRRNKELVWKGQVASLKRLKEDVREVQKGYECGVLLNNYNDIQPGDLIETYEVVYRLQEL